MDQWIGAKIEVFAAQTRFQGKAVQGLRVRPAKARQPAEPEPATMPAKAVAADDIDDSIPF
jgi:hypothetical protein